LAQHHDDDDGDDAVAKSLEPSGAHGAASVCALARRDR
jgi:hypothetical protein